MAEPFTRQERFCANTMDLVLRRILRHLAPSDCIPEHHEQCRREAELRGKLMRGLICSLRVGLRRSSGQGLRPDFRRDRHLFYREVRKQDRSLAIRAAAKRSPPPTRCDRGETRGPKMSPNDHIEGVVRAAIKDIGYERKAFTGHLRHRDLLHPNPPTSRKASMPAARHQQGRGRGGPGHHVRLS